jgi:predicted transcriptional regulator YheO
MARRKEQAGARLTKADELVLKSYTMAATALGAYFGSAFEFVLHDLTDINHAVIKIINGGLSGRREGAPVTDVALELLDKIGKKPSSAGSYYFTYFSKSKYGKPVKSVTMGIFGERDRLIGLFCVNMYLDQPITALLSDFFTDKTVEFINEHFINNSDELIQRILEKVKKEVMENKTVPPSLKNKEIITLLYHQGFFKVKNAIKIAAGDLRISKNTVYLHLRSLESL